MLEIDSLSKCYRGGIQALDNISLTIDTGVYGLLGANGAGKSSLMRTIATLQRPDSGSVRLDGEDIFKDVRAFRHKLGYLSQDLGAPSRVTANEMLDYLAGMKGIKRQDRRKLVMRQLELVNLDAAADRYIEEFSGGMRQRFGIAAATLGDPRIIIVDEPTAGLDPTERRRFQTLLAELAGDRILLLSSHIVEDIASLCKRMAMLDRGRLVAEGDPEQLIDELQGRVYRTYTSAEEFSRLRQKYNVLSYRPDRGKIECRILADSIPDDSFVAVTPDLEDFYAIRSSTEQ